MARTNFLRNGSLLTSVLCLGIASDVAAQVPAARPDLVISKLALSHDQAAPDSWLEVELTATNSGTVDAGPFRIAIYHSDGLIVPKRGNVTRIGAIQVDRGLGAGQSSTFSARVRLPPCDKCKPGSVYAYADAWGTVLERSEDNNFKAVPITVDPSFLPNLRVEKVSLTPDRGPAAREIKLSATVKNTTPYAAQGPFKLGLYCSDDAELTHDDLILTTFIHGAIAGNGQLTISRKLAVDTRCPVRGQQVELGIVADLDGAVLEANESDNSESAPYWVFRSPDLVVGQLSVSRDAAAPGSRIVLAYRLQNQGKVAALPFKVAAYISKNASIDPTDTLADTLEITGLAANTTSGTFHQELTVPALASGKYFVGVIVDVDDKNGELKERNNIKAVPLAIRKVNLSDRFFFLDKSSALPGDPLELRFSLRNMGADRSGPFKVAFYFSADPRLDAKDQRLTDFAVLGLQSGGERGEHVLRTQVPADAGEGYHYVLMAVDDGDTVAETDEYDNIALRALRILRK
ncbi:MAG: hypothetical protein IPI67_15225 [Myxococcales bacterium]|nr:hypothetical protein [Myxococcales bacterium]